MRRSIFVLPIAVAAGLTAVLHAQTGGSGQAAIPEFRTGVRLVQVSVVVHGRDGKPVPTLDRSAFTLLEDGKEQPVDVFAAPIPTDGPPDAPVAPDEFTNRLGAHARASVTAILFDRLNTRVEDQRQARNQIAKFLEQIRPEDRIGLYVLDTTSVRILHDFTNDAAALLHALAWPTGADRPPDDPDLAVWLSHTTDAIQQSMAAARVGTTTEALVAIASHLTGVRGRKNLIWVSSGVPMVIDHGTMLTAYNRATRAIDDANIAVYPVDARGLIALDVTPAETTPPVVAMRGKITSKSDLPERGAAQTVPNLEAMNLLAANTGGRAFYNRNDIAAAVRSAVDDGHAAYTLGYYPSHGKWDGTFRKIEVKVARPGLTVRFRRGYFALPAPPLSGPTRTEELLEQGRSPFAATGFGLNVRVSSPAGASGTHDADLAIHVDPGAITMAKTGDDWSGSLDLAIVETARDGAVVKSVAGSVDLQAPPGRYERLVKEGFTFTRTIPLGNEVARVHVVLRDVRSGVVGSLVIPAAAIRLKLRASGG